MKDFLIIGGNNAITYKEVFPLIKENIVRVGYNFDKSLYSTNTNKTAPCGWYTTLSVEPRPFLELTKHYNPQDYPTYDNYNAIEVSKTCNIPLDYDGVMGVPITFLDKYNPNQFEIIWTSDRGGDNMLEDLKNKEWRGFWDSCSVKGNKVYKRILIKWKRENNK